MNEFGVVVLKLFLAAIAGYLLGLEREAKHKPLGLKTCAVISIASCILTIISIETALQSYDSSVFIRADPMRLAAQIISGVGFLGAGVILRRSNDVISGLTTAAIVWAASGFGIVIGAGYYVEAAIGIGLIFFTVGFLPYMLRKFGPESLNEQELIVRVSVEKSSEIDQVMKRIKENVIRIRNVKIKGNSDGHFIEMHCFINDGESNVFLQYNEIGEISGVNQVEITGF